MTLSCLFSRPWRIPYSEHDLRGARGVFATLAWGHLSACPHCQSECARLRATGSALHHSARISRGRRDAVRDDLGSTLFAERVMTRVQSDLQLRRQSELRRQRQWTASVSFSFVLAGLGFAFTVYGPPSLARMWFTRTFPAVHRSVKSVIAKKPPFAMHDPFGSDAISARPIRVPNAPQVSNVPHDRVPTLFAQMPPTAPPTAIVVPNSASISSVPSAVEEAREATIVAEEAERERWDKSRAVIVPSPNGARLAAVGAAPARIAAQSAPPLLLANAETTQGANSVRARVAPASYNAVVNSVAMDSVSSTKDAPASPDDLRSLGLAPSTPSTAPVPSGELGAAPTGSVP